MTIKERQNPDIITPQKARIAAGAGVDISGSQQDDEAVRANAQDDEIFPGNDGRGR